MHLEIWTEYYCEGGGFQLADPPGAKDWGGKEKTSLIRTVGGMCE